MGIIDISYTHLLIGMGLLLIPFYFLWKLQTGILRTALVATLRMIVQMMFIGIYLKYLFEWDHPTINMVWALLMVVIASYTTIARTKIRSSLLFLPVAAGLLFSVFFVGLFFLYVVLGLENPFSAQYFISIFGLLMGNMITTDVIALSAYYSSLQREQQYYLYMLGNGATQFEALAPFIRQAVIKTFMPFLANVSIMGLVAFPGTMIGQILGGIQPYIAIKYQMMIMVITFAASMLSLMITIYMASKKSFDSYGVLKNWQSGS